MSEEVERVLEMEPEEVVELAVELGGEVVSVPPEPVGALGGVQRVDGLLALFGGRVFHEPVELVAGPAQVFPGPVFLGSSYPDIEVRVDPRAGRQKV